MAGSDQIRSHDAQPRTFGPLERHCVVALFERRSEAGAEALRDMVNLPHRSPRRDVSLECGKRIEGEITHDVRLKARRLPRAPCLSGARRAHRE